MLRTSIITDKNQRAMHQCHCRHSGGDTERCHDIRHTCQWHCRHSGNDTGRDVMTSDVSVSITVGTLTVTQRGCYDIRHTCQHHCRHSGGNTGRDVMTSDLSVNWYDARLMWKWRGWWWRSWLTVELQWQSTASGLQCTHTQNIHILSSSSSLSKCH